MRPALEVADIFRHLGPAYRRDHAAHLGGTERRVMAAIEACRTPVLGGHVELCADCGLVRCAYNLCRDRHCPKCQALARAQWLEARRAELLPVPYFHAVLTLPAPAAEIGAITVLDTWGQALHHHPHLHCIVPGGGISPDQTSCIPCRAGFLLPVRVLSARFRDLFLDKLRAAFARNELRFPGAVADLADPAAFAVRLDALARIDWVVYAKPPFAGPAHVLGYLARYTCQSGGPRTAGAA